MATRNITRQWTCPKCARTIQVSKSSESMFNTKEGISAEVASELMRKKNHHKQVGCENDKGSFCFLSTACAQGIGLSDDCPDLVALRAFRDQHLLRTKRGQALVRKYYDIAPSICDAVNSWPNSELRWSTIHSELVRPCVYLIQTGQFILAERHYQGYVLRLAREMTPLGPR